MESVLKDINNNFYSYQQLINFYYQNKNRFLEDINVSISGWFQANNCAMLGALLSLLEEKLNNIIINPGAAKDILEKNGFLTFFGYKKQIDINNTTISYNILSPSDERFFNNYVFNEFINKPDLPKMSKLLKKKITESIYEIFINSKMHSETKKIFTCGQYYPKKNTIEFMIADLGIGIKNKINKTFNLNVNAQQAIKWAVKSGNTTKRDVSGGIGLALLEEFIRKNKGKIQIISNDGFWELKENDINTKKFETEYPGTVVNITIRTDDDCQYSLIEEKSDNIF